MKGSVLVVDDERSICIAIERLLAGKGCEVVTASSVADAQRHLDGGSFDVLITDLSLHGGSGMELLRWVKAKAPATAVVMITAYGSEKVAVEAMKLGAADYLPKPFDNDELENALEQATALAAGDEIGVGDLPHVPAAGNTAPAEIDGATSFRDAKQRVVEHFERRFLTDALLRHGGNVTRAAADIGLYRQQLQTKLAEYGIDPEQFRE